MRAPFTVVIPTSGRPSLVRLLEALAEASGPHHPAEVIVVCDGDAASVPQTVGPLGLRALRSGGRGPAAARNAGWRAAATEWVAFLDDDVVPPADWTRRLARDLEDLDGTIAGSQGRVRVPLPAGRRPTDA